MATVLVGEYCGCYALLPSIGTWPPNMPASRSLAGAQATTAHRLDAPVGPIQLQVLRSLLSPDLTMNRNSIPE